MSEVDTLSAVVERAASAVEAAVSEHGAAAVDLTLTVVRLDAGYGLVIGVALTAAGAMGGVLTYRAGRLAVRTFDSDDLSMTGPFSALGCAGTGIATTIFGVEGLSRVFDPFLWAAVFGWPELKLVRDVLGGVL